VIINRRVDLEQILVLQMPLIILAFWSPSQTTHKLTYDDERVSGV
jgi:hypothetical protein